MVINVVLEPIVTVPNALISSALVKEINPQILSIISIHGGQVKIKQ